MTTPGDLYIAAVREHSHRAGDRYRVPKTADGWSTPENLGPSVNGTDNHDTMAWVLPDGRYIIFTSRGRRDGAADRDLYTWRIPLAPLLREAGIQ